MDRKLYIFDLDGTIYRGDTLLPGAAETIAELRSRGHFIRFLTNNSSLKSAAIADKLIQLGIPTTPSECYGTSPAAAKYLTNQGWRTAYVVGQPSLAQELTDARIQVWNFDGEHFRYGAYGNPDVVLVGICLGFTYEWMSEALQCLLTGSAFVATNLDPTYPLSEGKIVPGSGAIVASLKTCSGRAPIVIGKPEPAMIHDILAETGCTPEETVVVGDRMDTDIEAGQRAGCRTWLVLTGVTPELPLGQAGGSTLIELLTLD